MRRARDPNSLVGDDTDRHFFVASEAISRVGAQIHFMMTIGNAERLRELARSRAKTFHVIESATFFHLFDALSGSNARIRTKPFSSPFTSTFNIQCIP